MDVHFVADVNSSHSFTANLLSLKGEDAQKTIDGTVKEFQITPWEAGITKDRFWLTSNEWKSYIVTYETL